MMVTRFAWIAHRFESSNNAMRYASDASWSARTAALWNRTSDWYSCAISLTNLWNGSLRISRSVVFWYLRIYRRATVPGLNRTGRFVTTRGVLRAAFCAKRLRGCLCACFIATLWVIAPTTWAVCLVLAILFLIFDSEAAFKASAWRR